MITQMNKSELRAAFLYLLIVIQILILLHQVYQSAPQYKILTCNLSLLLDRL